MKKTRFMKINLTKISLLLTLLCIAACSADKDITTNKVTQSNEKNAIDSLLRQTAKEINQRLPIMVDEQTRLDSTFVLQQQLRYNFSLVNIFADQVDAYRFAQNMSQQIKKPLCQSTQMKLFFENDYPIVYQYHDALGSLFARIIVDPRDC